MKTISKVMNDARPEAAPSQPRKIESSYASILPSVVRPPTTISFVPTDLKDDPELPSCEHRKNKGVTILRSQSVRVYDCKLYNLTVNKNHCLNCPLMQKEKTGE